MNAKPKATLSTIVVLSVFAGIALLLIPDAKADSFSYSSTSGSAIVFAGDGTFSFTPGTGNFQVSDGTAAGLLGQITGVYTIGSIFTSMGMSYAPVSGTGAFTISDGTFNLTGTLQWTDIFQSGTAGASNLFAGINLTGITYGGSNADLLALASAGSASNVLTFQFPFTIPLASLAGGAGVNQTSFSGTVTSAPRAVPDSGSTVCLLGSAILLLAAAQKKLKLRRA